MPCRSIKASIASISSCVVGSSMTLTNTSAISHIASKICERSLSSTVSKMLAKTDNVSHDDPLSLYARLIAVKPQGLSANAWAVRAGLSRSVFTDIRKRNAANHTTIEKLLSSIGVTFADFEAGARATDKDAAPLDSPLKSPILAFRGDDRPRDIPILGTAECGTIDFEGEDGVFAIETMELDLHNVIDHARRPASLDNRRDVYGFYFTGISMEPRYEHGEIGYADPSQPPKVRDYAVVQLRRPDGDDGEQVHRVLAKRVTRMSASFIELEQFNPPAVFRVDRKAIKHIHRIIPWDELVSF
jgi:hypothetical protein